MISFLQVLEDDIASPAEIAKAYMGNQVSKVSPSMLGLRNRAAREGAAFLANGPFTPKSTIMSLSTKANAAVEIPENGFMTPRSRGRSAVYNMARTPYSRVHPTAFEKVFYLNMTFYRKLLNFLPVISFWVLVNVQGSGSRNYSYGGSLLPASSLKEPDGDFGSRKLVDVNRSLSLYIILLSYPFGCSVI